MLHRADLLAKFGAKPDVNSYQDFSDLLTEVTDARSNRWGLASSPLDYIRQMYSIPNNFFQATDGSFTSAYEDPRQKDALEAARKLQAKGLINPDMAAAPASQRSQWFTSGIGVLNWSTYTGWPALTAQQPGTQIGILQVPGFSGGQGRGWAGNLNNNMVSIPASAKNRAETLLRVIDWLAAPFGTAENLFQRNGIEGVHYTLNGTNPVPVKAKSNELGIGVNYLGSGPYVLYDPSDPTSVKTIHAHMSTFMGNAVLDPTNLYYSPTFGSRGAQLTSTVQAAELDIIYGRKPVSAWDGVVKDYLDGGGSQMKTELAAAVKNS
jgi:putative aldouronate transport system substrate-binding protein